MNKELKEMFGVNNIWELGYFVLYIFAIFGITTILLHLEDNNSFIFGFALGMVSVCMFKRFVIKRFKNE